MRMSRWVLPAAALLGLAVAVATGVLIYITSQEINLLGPFVYGVLAGGGLYTVVLFWTGRHQSEHHEEDPDHE